MESKRKVDDVEPFDQRISKIQTRGVTTMTQYIRCHERLNHALQSLFDVDLIKRKVQAYLEYRSKSNDCADENVDLVEEYDGSDYQIAQDILNGFRTWLNQNDHKFWEEDDHLNHLDGFVTLNPPEIEWNYLQFYYEFAGISAIILEDLLEFIFSVLTEMRKNGEIFSFPLNNTYYYSKPVIIYQVIPQYVWLQSILRQQPVFINTLSKRGAVNLAKNLSKRIKF